MTLFKFIWVRAALTKTSAKSWLLDSAVNRKTPIT